MQTPWYQLSGTHGTNRRTFLLATGSLAAAAMWSSCAVGRVTRRPKFSGYPFALGVASGDPGPDGVVLWTRLAPDPMAGGGMVEDSVEVTWQVAEDESMSRVVRRGTEVARADWAHSVHAEVKGLRPDRWYYYRFKAGDEWSPTGRTRTMPSRGSEPERLRFAFASCQHFEHGYFTAYEHMAREDLDLVVHLGDYIYEGRGTDQRVRRHQGGEIATEAEYRTRYAQYKSDPALQAMHAAAPWLVTWDDHEVDNNYAGSVSEEAEVGAAALLARRAAAYKVYYEHMPLRRRCLPRGPDMMLYRGVDFGRLAAFSVLDTRQYRTDQPCGDGNKPPCPGARDPRGTILGETQRGWLMGRLGTSEAAWNILAQQVMMGRVDRDVEGSIAYSMDQWPGYERERQQILGFCEERRIRNPVVLTGDIHTNWANELAAGDHPAGDRVVATEFVGTSITSGGDGANEPRSLAGLLADNPFVKYHNAERGYVRCEVTRSQWRTDYRTVEYVTRPGAPINTRASFLVVAGQSKLERV